MRLLRLHIENFGRLENFDLELNEGVNVLYKKNGWGKSTLAVFIKAMLYGLPATSRRSLDENERRKYTPWQGGAFGGSLEFECRKGSFRIERFFGAKEAADTFALYDLITNLPSTVFSASLGEELFGIDADGFERSTYLSQRELSARGENNSISAKLGNLLDDVGDIGNFDTAMEALDKRRKFYVMTGNRGAIADMDREMLDRQHELERCLRIKEAMEAQEQEREDCVLQIGALENTVIATRDRLQRAALARERAAHIEQKNRMLDELREMNSQLDAIKRSFGGTIPVREELNRARTLYEEIRTVTVRQDALADQAEDQRELARLRSIYPSVEGARRILSRMEEDHDRFLQIRAQIEMLDGGEGEDPILVRFPGGAPSQETIDHAYDLIEGAKRLQDATEELPEPPKYRHWLLAVAALAAVAGVLLAVLSHLLPGMGLILLGLILVFVDIVCAHRRKKARAACIEKREAMEQQRDAAIAEIKSLLEKYGIQADKGLGHALTELSLLSKQYRVSFAKYGRQREELSDLREQLDELMQNLRRAFDRVSRELPEKNDYRRDLEQVRTEVERLSRLEREEKLRDIERRRTEAGLIELKSKLLPFLQRYDPTGRLRAGECLSRIGELIGEAERLSRAAKEKEAELTSFIKEKKLDTDGEVAVDRAAYDRLRDEEAQLQKQLQDLRDREARLRSSIERLSLDADRVPDLRGEIDNRKLQIALAKENVVTIANTVKFLEEAKEALSTRYLGGMQESFSTYLARLSGEEVKEALMDPTFEVRLREGGQTRVIESFSRGWRDAVQFCVRLSLTDALFAEEEPPFLLLDDPFVNLDDERLLAARELLDKLAQDHQILYLVCHKERV